MNKTKTTTTKNVVLTTDIPNKPLGFVYYCAKQAPGFATLSILSVTFAQLCGVFSPFVLKKIIDSATTTGIEEPQIVFFWVTMFPTLIFFMYVFWRLSGFFGMQWLTKSEAFAHESLFEHLSQHSHTYFMNRFAGSVTNKLSHAAEGTFRLLDGTLWGHYGALINLVASGIFIFMTNFWVGVVYLLLVAILIPMNVFLARNRHPHVVDYAQKKTAFRGQAVDVVTNIGAMRQFSRREFELESIKDSVALMRKADIKQWKLSEWALVFNNMVIAGSIAVMMFIMYHLWVIQVVTVGDFVLVLTLIMGLQSTLIFIGNAMNQFIRIYGEVEEGLDEILHEHEIVDIPHSKKLEAKGGEIIWSDVVFKYQSKMVFDNFNLEIKPGQRIGLVGPSGAGKTTFVSLLLRQHDLTGGSISIDGQDIATVTQDSLRENIAVVPQEPMLFHRTIRENIAYGKSDATDEEITEVAKKAQAHDFIIELEEGYNTMVGERGVKLSGGQKQRVAIARAMLKNAPILVLDAATSALDSESEVEIQKALQILMEGKTVIAVAHRLSTLREMDRIIVLENGAIVEDGNHTTLTQSGGTYARLWEHQAGGFLQE